VSLTSLNLWPSLVSAQNSKGGPFSAFGIADGTAFVWPWDSDEWLL